VDINVIDAKLLQKMFLSGAKNLDAKKEWINELNVFPVPDGDTGTNMSMTILSAAREVNSLTEVNMKTLAKAISSGSLRGARGNSGVILSQLFRGFTKVIEKHETIDKFVISESFDKAVETAYKAVMKPKEGTILTVAKGVANKALELAGDDAYDLAKYIDALIQEADHVLSRTPEMLPVLKEAGVVDSGGQGLVQVLKGARDAFQGKEIDYTIEAAPAAKVMKISKETEAEIKYGYCTEFIVVLNRPLTEKEEDKFRAYLNRIGDSIVLVADDDMVKVHVHTNDPGNALQRGLTMGSLSRIKIDNMREEHQERLFKNSQKLSEEQASGSSPAKPKEMKEVGFIAVSAGEGLTEVFEGLGADYVISGGQTMNPSTDDFLQAIEKVNAKSVFIFPNNSNIILAANQAASLSGDKEVIVIPTTTVPQGVTALINYIPEQSAEENRAGMEEVIQTVRTGEVTYAVRDTVIDGITISKGDYMGIGMKKILSNGTNLAEVTTAMTGKMVDEESSIICLYYGADTAEEDAKALGRQFETLFPECEVDIQYGGQPVYYYIISVE
jgi:DAK2 domain fusion protein YloV